MIENNPDKQSTYNQNSFLQIRLHELLTMSNQLSANPYIIYDLMADYGHKSIVNILNSILQTIWSKLTPDEQKKGNEARKKTNQIVKLDIHDYFTGNNNKSVRIAHFGNRDAISNQTFEYRCLLEEFMDVHGFNPSKLDPKSSVIDY